MPSSNSYGYYSKFLECLQKYLEKDATKHEHFKNSEMLFRRISKDNVPVRAEIIYASFKCVFDELIKTSPSACMGGNDWLDKFFINVVNKLCTGKWCGNERCENYDNWSSYHCNDGRIPSKCKTWKGWRLKWRSYPEKEECIKCKYYKPQANIYQTELQLKSINEYKCYCRAKEFPINCPKKSKSKRKVNNE